jgi:two-component system, NtrC family, sensor kinase
MSLEAILALFLILHLRRKVRSFQLSPEWQRWLTIALYAVIGLFVLDILLNVPTLTKWVWHLLLLGILAIMYQIQLFSFARMVMIAVAPLIFVFLLQDIVKALPADWYESIRTYLNFADVIGFTWMIAISILSNRQQKAAVREQARSQEEEQRNRVIAARKEELELLVQERTSALQEQREELQQALAHLQTTQTQLIHREKMASLGELTAGIAHEIQNPLNFINNFSELNAELVNELAQETQQLPEAMTSKQNLLHILNDLQQNEQKILLHGKRADAIVKGMLQHARKSSGQKEEVAINALVDEYLQLSYHGFRAKDKSFNAAIETQFDENIGKVLIVPQEIGRVMLNLFNNAFYAIAEKRQQISDNYEPVVTITSKRQNGNIEIKVLDNGNGIPQNYIDKIFQPFFTTKPTGQGTGLGLSLSYDIIKAHGGELKVESNEGKGSVFTISLPI